MAAWRPWGNLPDNVLSSIAGLLRCRADRAHMARVNRHWRASTRALERPPHLPPQLPWLIFPDAEAPVFYTVFTDSYHPCRLPAEVRAARWRGSADDGWLVLALAAPHAYALYNLNSGGRIDLPPGFRSDNNAELPLVLLAAALSASPSNGDDYMVAAIALVDDHPTAAFWTPGRDSWFSTGGPLAEMPQDVIHYQDAFFFVTPHEQLVKFRAAEGPNGGVVLRRENLVMWQRVDYNDCARWMARLGRKKRYLVESGEDLLMVVRDIYYREGTDLLRVFRLFVPEVINGYRRRFSWQEIFQLDGRMLFLGPGCSRSFEVARYDGFQDHDSTIYFLDESFDSVPSEKRRYYFTDMARYFMPETQMEERRMTVEEWPPGTWPPTPDDDAPPTWWLH
ncbi:hypothetical protein QOZ80_1BG0072290 [Eleusine coracana subsp. coracana]|nr:hypothetical protein QOZ80_1BG0072290 [Eleusine coracana subsp. coracana]